MPITYYDGTVLFGTEEVTLETGFTYVLEDCTGTVPVNVVDVPDKVGSPTKQVLVAGKANGSFTLQLPNTGSAVPQVGMTGSLKAGFAGTGSLMNILITEVSTPRSVNDYAKVNCSWVKKLN
jgi:hypothetical protein